MGHKKEMSDFEKQYKMLNTAQKKAVDTIEGPVIVIAGPGTGKTQILTLRIANILKNAGAGIGPENILALTFTNAGVIAMRERLATFIGPEEAYRTNIYTFHSFCEDQIARYPDYFPSIIYSRVASDVEKINIVENILNENEFEVLKTFGSDYHYIKDILWAIDNLKRESITPDEFAKRIEVQEREILADEDSYYKRNTKKNKKGDLKTNVLKPVKKNKELQIVYNLYQQELEKQKLYDFTDMIMQFVIEAENDEEFASILREQYLYILVDEHQDTNDGQNRIIEVLTSCEYLGDNPNLFTVGDDKQAIYRFQGASVENFLHFEKKFPDAVVINLKDNYRSAQGILDEAHTLITSGDTNKEHTELKAFKKDKADVCVKHTISYRDELVELVRDIKQKIDTGVLPEDIAVFYREHNNLDLIKEVFEKEGIAYIVTSRQNILDDVQIQKLLIFLKVIQDPMDSAYLSKVLLTDLSDVDTMDGLIILDKYKSLSYQMSLFEVLKNKKKLEEFGLNNIDNIVDFADFIQKQVNKSNDMDFVEFFEQFVQESGFLELVLSRDDHMFLLKKLERLFDEVRDSSATKDAFSLEDFNKMINTFESYKLSMDVVRSADISGVNLMTAHGSKGLEFEHVYITNVVDGLWGGKRKNQKFLLPIQTVQGDMEDERRLFYVAMTRAKKSLTISYSDYDLGGREKLPSLFVSDLTARYIDVEQKPKEAMDIFFAPRLKNLTSLVSLDYIQEKFLTTPLSATALNNYFNAPILYYFRNLVRLPSVQNKTMLYGSVLHKALEQFFLLSKERGELGSKTELIEQFEKALKMMYVPGKYYESIKTRGPKALGGYYDFYKDEFNINVEVEKRIRAIPFDLETGEQILLTGTIDKIEFLEDGTVCVIDYKTGKPWSKKTKDEKEALRRQVVFYKLLLNTYNDGQYKMSRGALDFIEPHPDTNEYEKEIVPVSDADVDELKREINTFADDILTGAFLDKEVVQKYGDKSVDEYVKLLQILKTHK
jgi:DNA helicase-2/ATP-dependent DNA helicase PcrA